jgi:hypothetical protein
MNDETDDIREYEELLDRACEEYAGKLSEDDREELAIPLADAATALVLRNRIEEFLSVSVDVIPDGLLITSTWMFNNGIGEGNDDPIPFQRLISFPEAA